MTEYLVTWEINTSADTPQAAAAEAHRLVRKPNTTATVYKVFDGEGDVTTVDLSERPSIKILWGQSPEPGTEPDVYEFNTVDELAAFRRGIDAVDSWMGYSVISDD
ncbi:hypothetical protein [Rhizobium arsenicireducens]